MNKALIKENLQIIAKNVSDSSFGFIDTQTYFAVKYNALSNKIAFSDIDRCELEKYLTENEWTLLQQFSSLKYKKDKGMIHSFDDIELSVTVDPDDGDVNHDKNIWIKDKYLIFIYGVNEVIAAYDSTEQITAKPYLIELIQKYKKKDTNASHFYLLTKNNYSELDLKKYMVKVPENMSLNLNYGEAFESVNETICNKLNENKNGLYILHGEPGTGKSTYIKWLATKIQKKFIYVPEFMVSMINEPSVMQLFLEHTNSVIVLEDAEKAIAKREDSRESLASLILNLTDGILADIMQLSIIVTYNTDSENIDQALLRKGRLRYSYEFKMLGIEDIKKIMINKGVSQEQLNDLINKKVIKDQMSLADIYNIYDNNGIKSKKESTSFGFNT